MKIQRLLILVSFLFLFACGEDTQEASGPECNINEVLNPVTGVCVPNGTSNGDGDGDNGDGDGDQTPGDGDNGDGDGANGDGDQNPGDGDNGGGDQTPGDGDGENGDGDENPGDGDLPDPGDFCGFQMNQDSAVECSFLAHSPSRLYRIDPFRETVEDIGSVPNNLFDIDTHPDGRLFGISTSTLYRKDNDDSSWVTVGAMGTVANANGLCIDTSGIAYITASNRLYTVDVETAQLSQVGTMGTLFNSSGDCVIDKGDRLFMSNSGGLSPSDTLTEIDANTAQAINIGPTGFTQIYGLTAAWSLLIGTTGRGEVILINPQTGAGELIFQTSPSITFYGAASTPER